MRLHRFIGDFNLDNINLEITDLDFISQWHKVLKLKRGEQLILSNGLGKDYLCMIEDLSSSKALLKIIDVFKSVPEPQNKIHLYLSILKNDNFELAIQKVVECGVFKIIPVISSRTVKLGFNKLRLQKIIKEASEQSGRGIIPQIEDAILLDEAIKDALSKKISIICFDPKGSNFSDYSFKEDSVALFIGPEGGWSNEELKQIKDGGGDVLNLGGLIMRAETAAIVSVFAVANMNN